MKRVIGMVHGLITHLTEHRTNCSYGLIALYWLGHGSKTRQISKQKASKLVKGKQTNVWKRNDDESN
ncbi:hypothetical protein BCT19_06805 [Vibrio splendidus]|nr:hypothetical protein BCT19_06805 [Vibrio splendidus]